MASSLFRPSMPEDFYAMDIKNVCRICLQRSSLLKSIFQDALDEMISEFLPDKVDMKDNFPQYMCEKCVEDVKIAYTFKKQAEYAHEVVKKLLDGKRVPRSNIKKSYEIPDERQIFRTKSLLSDMPGNKLPIVPRFVCHICDKVLTQRKILRKHLERIHKFYKFEEAYKHLFDNSNRNSSKNTSYKQEIVNEEESYIEEMTFPVLPQVIMVDGDNDVDEDEPSYEEKDDPFKAHNDSPIVNKSPVEVVETPPNVSQPFECHLCRKRLTRRYYLKCHLERVHKFFDIDLILPKMIPSKGSKKENESLEKSNKVTSSPAPGFSHSTPTKFNQAHQSAKKEIHEQPEETSAELFECHICQKVLTRRYGLKKHLEFVHNFKENDRITDLTTDRTTDLTFDDSDDGFEPDLLAPSITINELPSPPPLPSTDLVSSTKPEPPGFSTGNKNKKFKAAPVESIPEKAKTKTVNVYICHICEKEFSGRATMRRHLKNVHKFTDFDNNIWLSKVYQKEIKIEEQETFPPIDEDNDQQFDQTYNDDDDIDMHAYLLCPEVVLTTGENRPNAEDNQPKCYNPPAQSSQPSRSNFDIIDFFEKKNGFKNEQYERNKPQPTKVEPIKLKLGVLSQTPINPDIQNNRPQTSRNISRTTYYCKFCQKPFNRMDHLNRHERTHTKPYTCKFCFKGFYREDLLTRHEHAAHVRLIKRNLLLQHRKEQQNGQDPGEFNAYFLKHINEIIRKNREQHRKESGIDHDSMEYGNDDINFVDDNDLDNDNFIDDENDISMDDNENFDEEDDEMGDNEYNNKHYDDGDQAKSDGSSFADNDHLNKSGYDSNADTMHSSNRDFNIRSEDGNSNLGNNMYGGYQNYERFSNSYFNFKRN